MKLLRIELQNVRGAPDGAYSLTDGDTGGALDVAIISGGPGSGRTSVLEAIAAAKEATGAYGHPPEGRYLLRRGATSGRVEVTWLLSEDERARAAIDRAEHTVTWAFSAAPSRAEVDPRVRKLFAEMSLDPARGKVEYFPASRLLALPGIAPTDAPRSVAAEARLRLTRDPAKYSGLLPAVRALALEQAARARLALQERGVALRSEVPDPLAPFREAISSMLPDLRLVDVDVTTPRGTLRFLRRDRSSIELDDLSDREQQGLLFALAFRYLGLQHSLVLVDEPELHVHASDHVRFLRALVALGRNTQFVVATGSAEIVATATRTQVIDLSARARREAT